MKVKEVADLVHISVRTLHHYDEIGLLKPDTITQSGYRNYSQKNLDDLQQILFFRALDVPLKKIIEIMQDPTYDRKKTLQLHRHNLLQRQKQITQMIEKIDRTLLHDEGEIMMTNEEKFKGFSFTNVNLYEKEAKDKWGNQTVDEVNKRIKGSEEELTTRMNQIYADLATIRHTSPASEEAQVQIEKWFYLLNEMGNYSLETFAGLGEMYVADERFTKNINQFGDGLATFMRDAMNFYAKNHN
ncbi:HTH-type transcriptional activator mta [Paraliobacillus sp. PM-2]|uniref:MerR family transcriptional regulator n=1 Tax=Paraliobacillus sp. PM-2 TaxID=1462524 RepID=UPI00061CB006|nr:MerR family transcriptional regulator [Paraliobacillus sp. PM-2]CQR48428.1 HTH-type transcriptional activator mta [Paraliobacillus sp. PM-2]